MLRLFMATVLAKNLGAIGPNSPATDAGLLNKRVEMTCEAVGVAPSPVVWTLTKLKLHK